MRYLFRRHELTLHSEAHDLKAHERREVHGRESHRLQRCETVVRRLDLRPDSHRAQVQQIRLPVMS